MNYSYEPKTNFRVHIRALLCEDRKWSHFNWECETISFSRAPCSRQQRPFAPKYLKQPQVAVFVTLGLCDSEGGEKSRDGAVYLLSETETVYSISTSPREKAKDWISSGFQTARGNLSTVPPPPSLLFPKKKKKKKKWLPITLKRNICHFRGLHQMSH